MKATLDIARRVRDRISATLHPAIAALLLATLLSLVPGLVSRAFAQASALDYRSVWQCGQPTFQWYCDDEAISPTSPPSATPPPAITPSPAKPEPNEIPLADLATARALRERLEHLQDRAIMTPTADNVRAYIEAQEFAMQKGALFSDVWRRVVWANPALDYSQMRPVAATAVRAYEQERHGMERERLHALAKEHGLLFFFRSDCPYCHAQAPTLAEFQRQFGFEVLPVSLDGASGGLAGFTNIATDRGQARRLGVSRVPALFIASRQTGDIAPLGVGVLSLTELADRIIALTTPSGTQY